MTHTISDDAFKKREKKKLEEIITIYIGLNEWKKLCLAGDLVGPQS